MKTTIEKLTAKVRSMDRAELELLALNVVQSLYAQPDFEGDDFEVATVLDSEKEWECADVLESVAGDVSNAGLSPTAIALWNLPSWPLFK